MKIYLYNSLTRKKEVFYPIKSNKIGIYVCGITVYDICHIGHARTQIFFDICVRYFKFCNYEVNYINNITDIDDKIIYKANLLNESILKFTNKQIINMKKDFLWLNIVSPNAQPKVTDNINTIIDMIKILIANGFAYLGKNNDVYYDINKYCKYGILSNQKIEKINNHYTDNHYKKNSLDFTLWKSTNNNIFWDSPWGKGRPGWHIECSAISNKYLGKTFDIHGGGSDLIFPHHENEIAQSVAANNCKMANYWMHCGLIKINNEKMSKSLNNKITIKSLADNYHPEVIRLFFMSYNYKHDINFSIDNLYYAKIKLDKIYKCLLPVNTNNKILPVDYEKYLLKFKKAMNDDFNFPQVIIFLFKLCKIINKYQLLDDICLKTQYINMLLKFGNILGILKDNPNLYFHKSKFTSKFDERKIQNLILKRNIARKAKNFKQADEIRFNLKDLGIFLEDKKDDTIWKRG